MRSRQEIKSYAKQAFAAQRSNSILAAFLPGLVIFAVAMIISIPTMMQSFAVMRDPFAVPDISAMSASLALSWLSIPLTLFTMVLMINMFGFFVKSYYGQPVAFSEPFTAFKVNFARKLGGACWEALWLYLWSLVGFFSFFIPTIIKALAYSQTQFILASNPNVTATNALKLSIRMTKGYKGQIFVMYLSFIGWQILNGLTLGILGIFFVNPYMYTSLAGLFVELRNTAVANGVIHPTELDGVQDPYQQQYQQYPQQYPPGGPAPYAQQPMQYQPQETSPYHQQPQQFQPQQVVQEAPQAPEPPAPPEV